MADFFFDDIALKATDSAQVAKNVRSPVIREVAEVYAANIKSTLSLMALPLVLLGSGIAETRRLSFFVQAMITTQNTTKWHESDEAKNEVDVEVDRLFKESEKGNDNKSTVINEAKHWLRHIAERQENSDSLQILLYTGVIWIWAALETVAKDLWIAAVNASPSKLGQEAFRTLEDNDLDNSLTRKQVSVGLLARHGFDLRTKLGVVLEHRFDFTSVSGIEKAYCTLFGRTEKLREMFSDPRPAKVEAMRHVIVHRAGYVDERYVTRCGQPIKLGEKLLIGGPEFTNLAERSVELGCELIQHIDDFLTLEDP